MISVLYVDDEPGMREVAQVFLEETGDFRVATAVSAKKALDSPDLLSYDAIISDYMMPVMDGIAFLKAVRERSTDIPFILFTGRGREEVVIEAINNGADSYIQKGGDPDTQFAELAHRIRHAVRRRKAELDRIQSEEKFSRLFLANPSLEAITDFATGTLIDVNEAWIRVTGYTRHDAIGKSTRDLRLFADSRDHERMLQAVTKEGIIRNFETRIRTKSGEIRTLDFIGQRIRAGDRDFLFSQAVDITERKRLETDLGNKNKELLKSYEQAAAAEEELREQYNKLVKSEQLIRTNEERLIMAQEIGHTGSWEYNIATNEIWGSAEGLHIFGFHRGAGFFPIEDIEACIPERERVHQAIVDLITGGREYNLEYAIHPADGSLPRMVHSVARLEKDAAGNPIRAIGVVQDITERKQREEELAFNNAILSTQQETSLDAILIVDEDGKILHYNQQFTRLWGVPEDLVAQRVDEPVLQSVTKQLADPEAFHARVKYLYEHKEEKSFEELLLKDGRVLERFSAPMLGKTGKYYGRVWYFRDITRRKQTEAALSESEQRFRNLIQNASDMIRIIGRDGLIRYSSPSTKRIVGYDPADVVGTNPLDYVHPDDRDRVKAALDDVFSKTSPGIPTEFRVRHRDGHYIDVETVASNLMDTPGINGVVTTTRPVTERKRADEALRRSEEKYRLLTENSIDIIYSMDLEGRITHISPHVARYGYTPDQLISHNISEVIAEEDLPRVLEDIQTTVATGKSTRTTFRLKDFPENPVWLEDNGTVIKKADGIATGISGVLRDITERRKTEEELRKSEERLRRLADNAPDMIYRMSLPDGRYEYVSPASLAMTGYAPEEFYADPGLIRRLIHPDWHEYFRNQWDALLANRTPPFYEFQIIDRAGNIRWVNQRNMLVSDENGKPVAIEGIVTDITRQKNTERELRRSQLRFLAVNENAGAWIWEVDPDGIYRYSSPGVTRLLGYRPEELVGTMHFYDLFDPSIREELKGLTLTAFASHEPFRDFVNLNRHKNGTPVLMSTSGTPVFDEDGTFTGYCGVDEDITERRRAEEALRQAHKKLHLLSGITRHDIGNQLMTLNGFVAMLHKKVTDPSLETYFSRIAEAGGQITAIIAFTKEYEKIGVLAPVWHSLAGVVNEAGKGTLPEQVLLRNDLPPGMEVFADPLIVKVFFNLLDNSIRHGQRVTEIRVSSCRSGDDLVIMWEDNGAGIADEEKVQIFEPGFGKNTGLGLFLVREILSLTGIRITETGQPGVCARFEMAVPKGAYRNAPEK